MKNTFFLLTLLSSTAFFAQETIKTITGKISDGRNTLENVAIVVEGTSKQTFSDGEGRYSINANVGDRISYASQGLKTVRIKVEDVTRILNIIMIPDITELEEVEVAASRRRSQKDMEEDYSINKNIIRTAWGYLDADRAAGNIRILDEDEINPVTLCILDLLRNQFPGVQVTGSCRTGGNTPPLGEVGEARLQIGGQVRIRPGNSIVSALPATFDIDGQIFTDVPWWLDVNTIKRIAILSNLATTATYGNLGAGGVVVVNTIGGSPKNNEFVDRARLRNNYADGLELSRDEVASNAPTYLKELRSSGSFSASKATFEKYHKTYSNSPYFLL
ncbi:MAG: carboxypeptidase-like regulatory domain-containing protein, partial [Bacteroidota bacterium]